MVPGALALPQALVLLAGRAVVPFPPLVTPPFNQPCLVPSLQPVQGDSIEKKSCYPHPCGRRAVACQWLLHKPERR